MPADDPSLGEPLDQLAFARLVSLACHDLRTPLATVYGFARTLTRESGLDERSDRFVRMMEQASQQMADLLDTLAVAARIVGSRWEPGLSEVDTLELAVAEDERIVASGVGATIETEAREATRALRALAVAALRHGGIERVDWNVHGRTFVLTPVVEAAAPLLDGSDPRDLGAVVARLVIGRLGGSVALDGASLRVTL